MNRWFKNLNPSSFSSSSSSPSSKSSNGSPKSPSSSNCKRSIIDLALFRNSPPGPRLTRQPRLRYADTGGVVNSVPVSRLPSKSDRLSGRCSSVSPLPLPEPELGRFLRRESEFSSSNSGDFPLPSPKECFSRGEGDEGDATDGDGVGEKIPLITATGRLPCHTTHKSSEQVDTPSVGFIPDCGQKLFPDLNAVENIQNSFSLFKQAKSAPISTFSSPAPSPRRLSFGDFFPPAYMASQGNQVSVLELPVSDTITGFSSQSSPEKIPVSPDRSPLHSPKVKSPGFKSKNPSCASSPLHPKMSQESSAAWHDSNGNVTVHPLPLPPGAGSPSAQSAFVHQTAAKLEVSSMASQWQKGKLIGSGTFGNVFAATNRQTGALCAMKEVNIIPDDPKSAENMNQLEQEIKVLSQLKHPNIVQYYGSEIVEDRFYIYLEYIHPGSINKYVREHCGAITEPVVRNFTRHILSGLAYLHSTKTIHRDIKGANLLVDASGVVKLADFGMAKHLNGVAAAQSLKGSPYWMAPEVMRAMMQNENGYDLAVDIWSLGCTIIEMFTGKPPWCGYEGAAAMFKVLKESPPIPENLSPDGKDFLECCFRRNPAERPSASVLLEHAFIRNSHHQEIPSRIPEFSGMKLMDTTPSPRERTARKSDSARISQGTQVRKGKISSYSQSHPETPKSGVVSHHSPRSTLEGISSLSPPYSNHATRSSSPSNVLAGAQPGVGKKRYVHPKSY